MWESIGWDGRETVGDMAHGFFYAQRTVDDRIAIGGRSVPYRYGVADRRRRPGARSARSAQLSRRAARRAAAGARRADRPRLVRCARGARGTGQAGVDLDRATGLGWAGGYVGHGVTATNLAGRTLADLVLDEKTPRTELPWVGHRSTNWEPEPLRWLGVRSLYLAYKARRPARVRRSRHDVADRAASPTGSPGRP